MRYVVAVSWLLSACTTVAASPSARPGPRRLAEHAVEEGLPAVAFAPAPARSAVAPRATRRTEDPSAQITAWTSGASAALGLEDLAPVEDGFVPVGFVDSTQPWNFACALRVRDAITPPPPGCRREGSAID